MNTVPLPPNIYLAKLPRFPLAQLPTPVESLPALTRVLGGPALLIKRATRPAA